MHKHTPADVWQRFVFSNPQRKLTSSCFPASDRWLQDIWRSSDYGLTWTQLLVDGTAVGPSQRAFAVAATMNNTVYVYGGQNAGNHGTNL